MIRLFFNIIILSVMGIFAPTNSGFCAQKSDSLVLAFQIESKLVHQYLKEGMYLKALEGLRPFIKLEQNFGENSEQREELHFNLGIIFQRMNAFDLAGKHFETALNIYQKRTGQPGHLLIGATASAYMKGAFWDKASAYFHKALDHTNVEGEESRISTTLNNLGILFLEQGKTDSAFFYFRKAILAYETYPFNDTLYPGSVRDNIARTYQLRGDYKSALTYFERNISTFADLRKPHSLVQALNGASEMLMNLNQVNKVGAYLDRASKALPLVKFEMKGSLELQWLNLQIRYAKLIGDHNLLEKFLERKNTFQDSLMIHLNAYNAEVTSIQASMQEIQFRRDIEIEQLKFREKETELARLESESKWSRMKFIFILVLTVLAGIFGSKLLYDRSILHQKRSELNEAGNKLLNAELTKEKLLRDNLELKVELKQQDLTNFALDNQRKRELLNQLEARLKKIKPQQLTRESVKNVLNDLIVQTQDDSAAKIFQDKISEVNAEYRSRLLALYPDLTQREVELCGMVRLGMQIKEIASTRNVTESAVQQARKRMRKKLGIVKGQDLGIFLNTI